MTCSGSVFQMRAPATGKAREPMELSRTAGTIRSSEVEDRDEKARQQLGLIAAGRPTVVRRGSKHGRSRGQPCNALGALEDSVN